MNLALLPQAPVWVLDEPDMPGGGQASAIAGRLGLPFRRLNAAPGSPHRPGGPGPGLVLSAGTVSGIRALWLRSRHGCRVVHCASRERSRWLRSGRLLPFDLTIMPAAGEFGPGSPSKRVIEVLGTANVVSPGLLARARDLWAERLSHLPHPRILILFGGTERKSANVLARHVASLAQARGGCVMACILPSAAPAGPAVADAFCAGLADCMHLIYRNGEPGDDPTLGFLGHADVVIAARTGATTLSEACASAAPIFVATCGSESRDCKRLIEHLSRAGQVRPLGDDLSPWTRKPLDEAGRVAREIRVRFGQS